MYKLSLEATAWPDSKAQAKRVRGGGDGAGQSGGTEH